MNSTLDTQLIEVKQRWREADDMSRAAQAELAASTHSSAIQIGMIRNRVEQANRLKKSIIKQIEALEESSLSG